MSLNQASKQAINETFKFNDKALIEDYIHFILASSVHVRGWSRSCLYLKKEAHCYWLIMKCQITWNFCLVGRFCIFCFERFHMIFSRISMGVHTDTGGVQVDSTTRNLFLIILCRHANHLHFIIFYLYIQCRFNHSYLFRERSSFIFILVR